MTTFFLARTCNVANLKGRFHNHKRQKGFLLLFRTVVLCCG